MTRQTHKTTINPVLKLALELGPLIVFFFANARGEKLAAQFPILSPLITEKGEAIYLATVFFMIATFISLSVSYVLTRKLPIMPLVSGVVVLVFGSLTLYFHNDTFIKMKPTIINTLFGVTLLAGLYSGKSFLKIVFDAAFQIDEAGWKKMTLRWGLFFLFLAVLNEVVWRNFDTDFWVTFKVWAVMPITLLFTFSQLPLIMRHAVEGNLAESDSVESKDKA